MPGFENRQEQRKAKRLESQPRLNNGGCRSHLSRPAQGTTLPLAQLLVTVAAAAASKMNSPLSSSLPPSFHIQISEGF